MLLLLLNIVLIFGLRNFGELDFVGGRNMITLYHILLVTINREATRSTSLKPQLVFTIVLLCITIIVNRPSRLLLFYFSVG